MGQLAAILELARRRGEAKGLTYTGEVTPEEAWTLLQHAPGTILVDVRTHAEWNWVGRVPHAVEIEWMHWPERDLNPNFLKQLEAQVDKEALVVFLCRSAARSHSAAMLATEHGYTQCYNILEGFEGDKDADQQRGNIGGWRKAGLPWSQS
jgi:rhodanese-related sulfurtransferase